MEKRCGWLKIGVASLVVGIPRLLPPFPLFLITSEHLLTCPAGFHSFLRQLVSLHSALLPCRVNFNPYHFQNCGIWALEVSPHLQ